jgi:hypothetical protein
MDRCSRKLSLLVRARSRSGCFASYQLELTECLPLLSSLPRYLSTSPASFRPGSSELSLPAASAPPIARSTSLSTSLRSSRKILATFTPSSARPSSFEPSRGSEIGSAIVGMRRTGSRSALRLLSRSLRQQRRARSRSRTSGTSSTGSEGARTTTRACSSLW